MSASMFHFRSCNSKVPQFRCNVAKDVIMYSRLIRDNYAKHPSTIGFFIHTPLTHDNFMKIVTFLTTINQVEEYVMTKVSTMDHINSATFDDIIDLCTNAYHQITWHDELMGRYKTMTAKQTDECCSTLDTSASMTDEERETAKAMTMFDFVFPYGLIQFIIAVYDLVMAECVDQIPTAILSDYMPHYAKVLACYHGKIMMNYVTAMYGNNHVRMNKLFSMFGSWCLPMHKESYFSDMVSFCKLFQKLALESLEMYMRHLNDINELTVDFGYAMVLGLRLVSLDHPIVFKWAQYIVNCPEFAPIHKAINTLYIYTTVPQTTVSTPVADIVPAVVTDSESTAFIKVHPLPESPPRAMPKPIPVRVRRLSIGGETIRMPAAIDILRKTCPIRRGKSC